MKEPKGYYAALIKHNPTIYTEFVNQSGQKVQLAEHPAYGDESFVIAMFPELEMAFDTDFFDTDDMTADDHEYEPYVHNSTLHYGTIDFSIEASEQEPNNTKEKFARQCDACGSGMNEGYIINGGEEYFCSDECLHTEYTQEEYEEMHGDDDTETYWTEWEDDDTEITDEDMKHLRVIIDNVDLESGLRASLYKIQEYITKQRES
jgi:hypothetical protein